MDIEIREVQTNNDVKQFVLFPYGLYRNNKYWIPPLIKGEFDTLNRDKNPAFDYCDARYWLAIRDGKVVGRIAGIVNKKYIKTWQRKVAGFGWFDFIDDRSVAEALLACVEEWARSEGMEGVHGPMGFTNFDRQGMLIEGFEELPTIVSVYNYEYYPKHMKALGYRKETDYLEFEVKTPDAIPEKAERIMALVQKRKGIRLARVKSKKELLSFAPHVFDVINKTHGHLFSFVELSEKQVDLYTKKYFPFIQPDYVSLLLNKEDHLVGFQIAIPSLSRAMQKAGGRLFPFGFFHLMRALKHPRTLDLYLVGILPEYQNQGLNALFMTDLTRTALEKGIVSAETNSELEDNKKIQDFWKYYNARQHKRKRVYYKMFG